MDGIITAVCGKLFCKATFKVGQDNPRDEEGKLLVPKFCPSCTRQECQVTWEDKRYEGERWDSTPHQFTYKIKKFY